MGVRLNGQWLSWALLEVIVLTYVCRTDAAASVGVVGVPMVVIFDYAMGTPSGHAAFLDPDVNMFLKKLLNQWGEHLKVGDILIRPGLQG